MISFREKSSTFSCQQCCAETQELGPQLCLVWRWGLQLALGTACRSGWLLGALEQAGSLYFFLLFGILRVVLHDWLCKKFQRSNIVPFAPLVFFFSSWGSVSCLRDCEGKRNCLGASAVLGRTGNWGVKSILLSIHRVTLRNKTIWAQSYSDTGSADFC